ncbi:MAG TPA: response regulator transcription factor [Kofleriaceae bacterium]|nr:response regulator transcription factor [Kofleriaceae bacterium]
MTKTRVLLVDDHAIVRYGFAQLLAATTDLEVCGQAADAHQALEALASAPDVVIVDVSLGATNGIDLIREIKLRAPGAAVLVVSMHDEQLYADRALRAGATGYVMKHEATDAIVRAIRIVAAGGIFVSEAVSMRLVQRVVAGGAPASGSPVQALSDRELHVLELMGRGLGTRAIAEQLHISVKTVESYRARLKEKMNLRTGTELVRFAVQWAEQQASSRR